MKKIGSYEAKTHLSRLLEQVAAGQGFTITKHGVPVAQLLPISGGKPRGRSRLISDMLNQRKKNKLGKTGVKKLVREGRKY